MRRVVAKFSVEYLQILDENGVADAKMTPKLPADTVRKMYEAMVRGRVFDETALKMQREGRIGTYASIRGQEASNIGPAFALDPEDWVFPAFRENGTLIARGLPMVNLFQYWGWDERGMQIPKNVNCFTIAIPVSTQIPHAVGFAWAMKMQKKRIATAVFFGDGATSKGDFSEGLNFAGTFALPIVFINQNNQWAISVPRTRQSAAETLAQKAIAYGFEGVQVDGNDVFAVYSAVREAVKKAKEGGGPTLIECFTYRMGDHTTADDAKKYRDLKEVTEWERRDPIRRLQLYMKTKSMWDEKYEKELLERIHKEVEDAVKKYEATPPPPVEDIFRYMYAEMDERLQDQLAYLKRSIEEIKSMGDS